MASLRETSFDDIDVETSNGGIVPLSITVLLDEKGNKIKVWDGDYKEGADHFVNEIKEAIAKR